jgi:AraC family transcriptional activator of pobA
MSSAALQHIKSITEFHKLRELPKPLHPLVSVIDYSLVKHHTEHNQVRWIQDYYTIGLKRNVCGKFRYGQQAYDFDEGLMSFIAPGQVVSIEVTQEILSAPPPSGRLLLFHPDFLWNTSLAKSIHQYEFFGYDVHESLFLSDKEEQIIFDILQNIEREYQENIDRFSQNIIVSQLETLLNYAERFYQRQFTTRKKSNHRIVERLEALLHEYFNSAQVVNNGLPTVAFIAQELHVSANYLSTLLKTVTGKSTQQHIQDKVIEKAKEKLSTTDHSISQIAYELGFEHPPSFTKLFKAKTNQSPLVFRASFQ